MTPSSLDPFRVVLIGPECTGKTWLASALARRFRAPWSPEFARTFVDIHPRPVEFADVEPIGRGQQAGEDDALASARAAGTALVIHDTDLVSTSVYSEHYYGACPGWIAAAAAARLADLYLLHETDVPWTADGHQREAPERRGELFERFRDTLQRMGANVVRIAGSWDARERAAIAAIDGLLASRQIDTRR